VQSAPSERSGSLDARFVDVCRPIASTWAPGWKRKGAEPETFAGGALSVQTTHLDPSHSYAIEAADSESGPFVAVQPGITLPGHERATLTVQPTDKAVYRMVRE
jgi:hypothetical protein